MKLFIACTLAFSLSSCTNRPSLEEELAGKSKKEQHAILKSECLFEARWQGLKHYPRLFEICNRMAAEMK